MMGDKVEGMKGADIADVFSLEADEKARGLMEEEVLKVAPTVEIFSVCKSLEAREIKAISLGSGKRYIVYVGAHHATERISASLLYLLVHKLLTGGPDGMRFDPVLLLSRYKLYVIPCVNPDGIELSLHGASESSPLYSRQMKMSMGDFSHWQANGRGVDLNHNYACGFSEYKEIEGREGITAGERLFSGEYPESEPESRGVAAFIRALAPSLVVSLHTQGEEVYYSPRGNADGGRTLRIAERFADRCGYKVSVPQGTAAYGGLCDYTGAMGIPSLTVELGRGENPLPASLTRRIFARVGAALADLGGLL